MRAPPDGRPDGTTPGDHHHHGPADHHHAARRSGRAYQSGDIGRFGQTIYIGTTFDEPLPAAFLTDAANPTRPLLWANYNIWQVVNASPTFASRFGFCADHLRVPALPRHDQLVSRHPYLPIADLRTIVEGMQAQGWTFVAPGAV